MQVKTVKEDDVSSKSDSSSDSSDSEEEAPAAKEEVAAKDDDNSSSDDDSDDDSDDSTQSSNPPEDAMNESTSTKRKSEPTDQPEAKRPAVSGGGQTKIYVRGLPWRATEDEVREYFMVCGQGPVSVELPLQDDGRSSGTAIIDFGSDEDAAAAIELNGNDFHGRWLSIRYKNDRPILTPRAPSQKEEGCVTVFIGNLPWDVDEGTIRETFGECGEINMVRFSTDRETGEFKGYGHVEFCETEATDKAVKLAGTEIMGRAVRVDFANDRRNSNGFGGGRGGGRGFGRGGGGGRSGGRGGFGRGGGRGGGHGRGGSYGGTDGFRAKRSGAIAEFSGNKITFD